MLPSCSSFFCAVGAKKNRTTCLKKTAAFVLLVLDCTVLGKSNRKPHKNVPCCHSLKISIILPIYKRALLPNGLVWQQIVWNCRFGDFRTSDTLGMNKKKDSFSRAFFTCRPKGQDSDIDCSLEYSYLKIHRLTTNKKDFSTPGFLTTLFFGCFLAGISSNFVTVVFIRHDLRLLIICQRIRPSQKFQLKRKRNK